MTKSEQNRTKREAWQSREKSRVVSVNKARKTKENASFIYLLSKKSSLPFCVNLVFEGKAGFVSCKKGERGTLFGSQYLYLVVQFFLWTKGRNGSPHLGLWYPNDSPFDLVAYSDNDYAGASLDRKSTTEGCQFLGCRLISWQCKKQTVVATSSTKAEYVAAASCCAQVLWIQNQLMDYGKKVGITKAAIRDVLRLDDAEGVDCQPNEEIFPELACMGYEKPSTKLTFYKAFFSSQWKFLIHIILMSAKHTSWNEFSSAMASAVICLSTGRKFSFSKYIFESLVRNVDSSSKFYMYPRFIQLIIQNQLGDLSTHITKYTSPSLTQKVFANMRRVGKGFSRVETPLFEGMLVAGEPEEQGDAEEQLQDNVDDAAQGADTAVLGDDVQDQSITSPTPPPQQPQDLPSTSQEALDACVALTRRVEHLEHDKVAHALKITKLKKRVKKLDRANKGRMIADLDRDTVVALMDDEGTEKKAEDAQVAGDEQVKGRQAKIYQIDMDYSLKVLSMQKDEPGVQVAMEVVTTAKLITEVVAAVSESVTAASATIVAVP
nr:uncharacterized mitochondrial protein AtMg00810-like [Tanacetum cinerariifolium]